jgi:hypothetical protein
MDFKLYRSGDYEVEAAEIVEPETVLIIGRGVATVSECVLIKTPYYGTYDYLTFEQWDSLGFTEVTADAPTNDDA